MRETITQESYRKSDQRLLPVKKPVARRGEYDLYPAFQLVNGRIESGFAALAKALPTAGTVVVDGHGGVLWNEFRAGLRAALDGRGVASTWLDVSRALLPIIALDELLAPYLGGDDPIFGRRYPGTLADLFDPAALTALGIEAYSRESAVGGLSIVYGCGATLSGVPGPLVYVDVPKNEVQYRSRAGSVVPLGAGPSTEERTPEPKRDYKRFFFVDWPLLSQHKGELLSRVDLWVDAQRLGDPSFTSGGSLRDTLDAMSTSAFRVRPWFEAGPWGGEWLKERFRALPQPDVNYAWSFELITPENGLLLEHDGRLLETSFDTLMFQAANAVLGEAAPRFGVHFPIRFNYLDTFGGGNLSLQVHPSDDYVRERFGQGFTQDETYYITDTTAGARIYLGLHPTVDLAEFRAELESVNSTGDALDVDRFVHSAPARRHDLYLIPNGTIHSAGAGNVVLEISATTYLFTFKVYDWQRLDLDGKPRPINLERAFDNLDPSRIAGVVESDLRARTVVLDQGEDWRLVHLETSEQHFYDVHRFEFESQVESDTAGCCHVLNLVAGAAVEVSSGGRRLPLNFGETAVVPAAAGQYRIVNLGPTPAMVVKAFVKVGRGGYQA